MLLATFSGLLETAFTLSTRHGLGVERASAVITTVFLTGTLSDPSSGR
jgi:hypothetical protein